MAEFTFDGRRLTKVSSGQKLAEVDRDSLRSYNGAVFGQVEGRNFRDNHGKKVAEFNGKEIQDDRGKKVITIKEIQEVIEGTPSIELAAMWYFFVRGRKDHVGVL
jgi:hypothetical protein